MSDAAQPPGIETPDPSKDPVQRMLNALGHQFENDRLLLEAITHRSYVNEAGDRDMPDNERFEFLGDAVIDLVVSSELMRRFPRAREGKLSKFRAAMVSEPGLAELARSIELGEALRLGRGEELSGGREKPSILADSFEAVIAAVYLDAGLAKVTEVLVPRLAFPDASALWKHDPKTELQQRIQAVQHRAPTYHLIGSQGPEHAKEFEVEIRLGDEVLATGRGRTKKEAEQRAAAGALEAFEG